MTQEKDSVHNTSQIFVLVLMPFSNEFNDIYRLGIKAAVQEAGANCERVDEQVFAEDILERIYNQIAKADIVVAEMTGRNPNVYYETGYAHAINKRVILLTQNAEDIPFDLKHYPHIIYGDSISNLKSQLKTRIRWYIENPDQLPLPQERKFHTLEEFYSHVIYRMNNSKRIDDLSWAKPETQEKTLADRVGYENYLKCKDSICRKEWVTYREVFTFPSQARFERAKAFIEKNYYGYNVSYHPISSKDTIPRISFTIFDSTEVVIFFYLSHHKSSYRELRLSIAYPSIVKIFQDYYDGVFERGIILKDAHSINYKELEKLEKLLYKKKNRC